MRTFIAIKPSLEAITILSGQIEKLRRAEIPGLRMVRPEGVHLTLKFLGEISQEKILSIQRILEQLAEKTPAFSLQLSQAGVFPSTNPALVLWIGVAGDLTALQGLQMSIDSFLDPIGFASTNSHKTFQPHLTVARFNQRPKKNGSASLCRSSSLQLGSARHFFHRRSD